MKEFLQIVKKSFIRTTSMSWFKIAIGLLYMSFVVMTLTIAIESASQFRVIVRNTEMVELTPSKTKVAYYTDEGLLHCFNGEEYGVLEAYTQVIPNYPETYIYSDHTITIATSSKSTISFILPYIAFSLITTLTSYWVFLWINKNTSSKNRFIPRGFLIFVILTSVIANTLISMTYPEMYSMSPLHQRGVFVLCMLFEIAQVGSLGYFCCKEMKV